jgi:HK97 family phage portal protein
LWLDLVGDAFYLKERNGAGAPIALWPLPPQWVIETPTDHRPTFRVAYRGWYEWIPKEEILWLHYNNPVNPYGRGSGVARALDDEIAIDEYAAKHTLAYFRNNARPDLLVMPKEGGTLGEIERDRMDQWWTDKLQGYWRRHKPLFMTRPMDVQVIDQKLKDMQLTELRSAEADTILQTWGVPPEIFGRLANSNKATVDKAIEIFARFVLTPRLERIRESLQERLVPEYDDRIVISYDSPIPTDKAHALMVFKSQPNAFELQEFRKLAGLPPHDELEGQFGTSGGGGFGASISEEGKNAELENMTDDELRQLWGIMQKAADRQSKGVQA